MQNSHWNAVHILFSLLRWLLCKACKIFFQKCCLFWAFQQNYKLFLEGIFSIQQEIWGRMVDCAVCKGVVHPFNPSLYLNVASSCNTWPKFACCPVKRINIDASVERSVPGWKNSCNYCELVHRPSQQLGDLGCELDFVHPIVTWSIFRPGLWAQSLS